MKLLIFALILSNTQGKLQYHWFETRDGVVANDHYGNAVNESTTNGTATTSSKAAQEDKQRLLTFGVVLGVVILGAMLFVCAYLARKKLLNNKRQKSFETVSDTMSISSSVSAPLKTTEKAVTHSYNTENEKSVASVSSKVEKRPRAIRDDGSKATKGINAKAKADQAT